MKAKLKNYFKQKLGGNYDLIDIDSLIDSSLSYAENKERIIEECKKLGIWQEDLSIKQEKALSEKYEKEQEEILKEYLERENAKCVKYAKSIKEGFERLEFALRLLKDGFVNAVFVKGPAGIGKSFFIHSFLLREKVNFVKFQGEMTVAYLYRFLYQNSDKIIWFDDVGRLLRSARSVDLLKSACYSEFPDGKRVIKKGNYSPEQRDLPDSFIFEGGIIFSFNRLQEINEDVRALLDRGVYIELVFSQDDIIKIMREIAKGDKEKEKVTEFLIKNKDLVGHGKFNLRLQQKAFRIYEYCIKQGLDWKQVLKRELEQEMSEVQRLVYSLIGFKKVRPSAFVKALVRPKGWSKRTAERRVNEWLELGEIYSDGKEKFQILSLKPF